jgi:nitrogen fixation-related uncharacterized protein
MSAVEIFARLWIAYLVIVFIIVIVAILWAKRTGQFTKTPRASSLPLEIDGTETLETETQQNDRDHVSRTA